MNIFPLSSYIKNKSILNSLRLPRRDKKLTIKSFKKHGGCFVNGRAFYKGKEYSGRILIPQDDKDIITLQYKNSYLQTSKCNKFEKKYCWNPNNKLLKVKINFFNPSRQDKTEKIQVEQVCFLNDRIELYSTNFSKTQEAKTRTAMSDDEIKAKAQDLLNEYFKKRHIDESLKPKIIITHKGKYKGCAYYMDKHEIRINADSYKSGYYNLEDTIAHEMTHCIVQLLKHRLSKEQAADVVRKALVDKIFNGEREEILVNDQMKELKIMKPPKMSSKMKQEFANFACRGLFKEYQVDLDSTYYTSKLNKLLDENPDFIEQYGNRQEAMNQLKNYSRSHNIRYALVVFRSEVIKALNLKQLAPKEEKQAIKAYTNYIDTIDGNRRLNKYYADESPRIPWNVYNQYQFSSEEAKANIEGAKFFLEKLKQEYKQLKKQGNLSTQFLAYYKTNVDRLSNQIEYYKKGVQWYEKYVQSLNNPQDEKLSEEVSKQEEELKKIEFKTNIIPMINVVYYNNPSKIIH